MFYLTEYRVMPNAGGFLDQDRTIMQDFNTLLLNIQWQKIPAQEAPALTDNW